MVRQNEIINKQKGYWGSVNDYGNVEEKHRTTNKEFIQNSLNKLENTVTIIENNIDELYGNNKKCPIPEEWKPLSFNDTILEVPDKIDLLNDRLNNCINAIRRLDAGI